LIPIRSVAQHQSLRWFPCLMFDRINVVCNSQVIVLSLRGPLCSDEVLNSVKSGSTQLPSFANTIDVIRILLRHFNVGIWSSNLPNRLEEVVDIILPPEILSQILFVCASTRTRRPYDYCYFLRLFKRTSIERRTGKYLWPKCVVVADLDPYLNPRLALVHYLQYLSHKTGRLRGICKDLRLT
jgi:hypothetical protein